MAGEAGCGSREGFGPIGAPNRMLPSPGADEARGRAMKVRLYNTQRCPYARRTRMVLPEKGVGF